MECKLTLKCINDLIHGSIFPLYQTLTISNSLNSSSILVFDNLSTNLSKIMQKSKKRTTFQALCRYVARMYMKFIIQQFHSMLQWWLAAKWICASAYLWLKLFIFRIVLLSKRTFANLFRHLFFRLKILFEHRANFVIFSLQISTSRILMSCFFLELV